MFRKKKHKNKRARALGCHYPPMPSGNKSKKVRGLSLAQIDAMAEGLVLAKNIRILRVFNHITI